MSKAKSKPQKVKEKKKVEPVDAVDPGKFILCVYIRL